MNERRNTWHEMKWNEFENAIKRNSMAWNGNEMEWHEVKALEIGWNDMECHEHDNVRLLQISPAAT